MQGNNDPHFLSPSLTPRVLIAEDAPDTRALLKAALCSASRPVPFLSEFACDGAVALEMYRAARAQGRPYALLVLDAAMPNLDGHQVAESIRQTDKETRICFFTAFDDTFIHARAMMVNAFAMWKKPADVGRLPQLIEEVLNAT